MTVQPNNERKFRLECLKLSIYAADPEGEPDANDIMQRAETFYRYVIDGAVSNTVLKIVGK